MVNTPKPFGYVYKITNKITKKVYIGQTITTPEKRFDMHFRKRFQKESCTKLSASIRKHGIDNFELDTLCVAFNREDLNKAETDYIAKFDSIKNGYNLKEGGSSQVYSKESRAKMSISQQKRWAKGESAWNKGLKMPEEQRVVLADRMRKMAQARKRPVKGTCIATGHIVEFDSPKDGGRAGLGFNECGIRECIKGNYSHHHGYKWEYTK